MRRACICPARARTTPLSKVVLSQAKRASAVKPRPFGGRESISRLLAATAKLGRNVGEGVIQLAANGVHGTDDDDRDTSRNQAILNSGRTALVLHETLQLKHESLPH